MGEGEGATTDRLPASGAVRPWLAPLGLALVVIAVYAASLRGGFLNYDDDWLIENNPIFRRADALRAIWTDLGAETRQQLGAEYLPVRDTLMWLEVRLCGLSPHALRAVSLLLYLAALLLLRRYLRATLADVPAGARPPPAVAELAVFLFAVHPVHVESVAWLAGQKDLCALVLAAAALLLYARGRAPWAVPLLVLLAALGKGVAVAVPLLLLAHDWLTRRRPGWTALGALVAAAIALVVHLRVGRMVGMLAPWPGGGRMATAATMGPIWLRYLVESFVPVGLSIRHEVAIHGATDLWAWAAYLPLVALAAAAVAAARRGRRLPAFALAWFIVPLLPTSQVLAPLQNVMADRYLLLAVLGPCLALAALGRWRPGLLVVASVVAVFGALTVARAGVFTGSVPLWTDAVAREPASARAHYQLGMALRQANRPVEAEAAFRRALAVAAAGDDIGRRAANNLAALLASSGRLQEAQAVLRDAVARFPDDPRALGNLAEVTARLGQEAEARRLFETLRRRFPRYLPGERNFERHFHPAAAPTPPPGAPAGPRPGE
jgi:protein O-mannosyl-transferase